MNVVQSCRESLASKKEEILKYWFGSNHPTNPVANMKLWFSKDAAVDEDIRFRFEDLVNDLLSCKLSFDNDVQLRLAAIVCLDQFPRNIYRGTPKSFAGDQQSLKIVKETLLEGYGNYNTLAFPEKMVFLLPLMHSEDSSVQEISHLYYSQLRDSSIGSDFEGFGKLCFDYAMQHKVIIDQFGRYPHRNEILGRQSTSEETEFLKKPNSSF